MNFFYNSQGWGKNPDNPGSNDLYRVDLKVVSSKECANKWGGTEQEYEQHEVCALGDQRDTCSGDSGGPLLLTKTNRQIGIVSYGATCDNNPRRLPGVYTKIQDNLDFIQSVIHQN